MNTYAASSTVAVTFAMLDEQGAVLTPTSLRYRVTDEDDEVLVDWSSVSVTTPQVVTVLGAYNMVTPPATVGIRSVELEVTTAGGVVVLTQPYKVQAAAGALVFGVNSIVTYNQALLLAEGLSLPGWDGGSRADRERALMEAWQRILLLPIKILWDDTQSVLEVDAEFLISYGPILLYNLTPAQMATLYKPLLDGLKKAQLTEADEILSGDGDRADRDRGLVSKTVGESSETYRQGATAEPLRYAISKRALQYIRRWFRNDVVIGRC